MSIRIYQKLPFPYFCLDQDLHIDHSSVEDAHSFSFTRLLSSSSFDEFKSFLFNLESESSRLFELKLNGIDSIPYEIYKVIEKDQIHLFCIPVNVKPIKNPTNQPEKFNEDKNHCSSEEVMNLATNIAHEVKNSLTSVKGFIQLSKPYLSEIHKDQYTNVALEEIDRANEILYQLLDLSRPYKTRKKKTSLNKIVKDVSLLYESEATLKMVSLKTQLTNKNPYIMVDEKQLKQVLINLVKNAVESITEGQGEVTLCTEVTNDCATIFVRDNGCGISTENLHQLFNPYFTTKSTGTGIGLAICKKIIDENGGVISVESFDRNGTTFKIQIPILNNQILYA